MNWLVSWWNDYKEKLAESGYDISALPKDFNDFIEYLSTLNGDLDTHRSAVRYLVKEMLGIEFAQTRKTLANLRRGKRLYQRFKLLSMTNTPMPKGQKSVIEYLI